MCAFPDSAQYIVVVNYDVAFAFQRGSSKLLQWVVRFVAGPSLEGKHACFEADRSISKWAPICGMCHVERLSAFIALLIVCVSWALHFTHVAGRSGNALAGRSLNAAAISFCWFLSEWAGSCKQQLSNSIACAGNACENSFTQLFLPDPIFAACIRLRTQETLT